MLSSHAGEQGRAAVGAEFRLWTTTRARSEGLSHNRDGIQKAPDILLKARWLGTGLTTENVLERLVTSESQPVQCFEQTSDS